MTTILAALLGLTCLFWCGVGTIWLWTARTSIVLEPETRISEGPASHQLLPSVAPSVSILVPARNEEEVVRQALEALLHLDYPNYQVIVVDDGSTDRTGALADEWAARSGGRLTVIHNRILPPGWRGKVHALNLAAQAAQGEWLLATDADVVLHPASLRLAMSCALANNLDLISLIPQLEFGGFWERVMLPAFTLLLGIAYPLPLVNRPASRRALAAGGFILMRRSVFESLGGYAALRGTLIEDLRTAQLFKQHGHRIALMRSRGLLRTRMYSGLGELWEGLSRTAFEGVGFSVAKLLAIVSATFLLGILPWLVWMSAAARHLFSGHAPPTHVSVWLGVAACALSLLVYLPVLRSDRVAPWYALTLPLAMGLYSLIAISSAWMSLAGKGIAWKGRRYRQAGNECLSGD